MSSAICPGQATLLPEVAEGQGHYLCANFFVCYEDGEPNYDEFYLHNYPLFPFTIDTRDNLCRHVYELLQAHGGNRVTKVIYAGYYAIQLSDEDVGAYGWRFISGNAHTAAPTPAPTPEPVVPTPAQPAAPAVAPAAPEEPMDQMRMAAGLPQSAR